jgi:predicted polyphosphate/ATP-dependent NAD kinase
LKFLVWVEVDDRDQNYLEAPKKNSISENWLKNLDKDSSASVSFIEAEDVIGLSELEDAETKRRKIQAKLGFLEGMLQRVNGMRAG